MIHQHTIRLLLLLMLFFFLLISSCNSEKQTSPDREVEKKGIEVKTLRLIDISVADQIEIMGNVNAAQKAAISSRISGNIVVVNVVPGSRVAKGDILLEINAGEISAKLLKAKAELDQASRNLKREKKLFSQKATTSESVKDLEDIQRIAEAGYKEAKTMLGYTSISAPFDGLVTRKLIDVGDLATPGKPLLYLEDDKNLRINVDIPETVAQNTYLDMQLQVSVPAAHLETPGRISEISPSADPVSRTVPMKIVLDSTDQIKSGQFARVILPGEKMKTLIIPRSAISTFGQLERVFIVSGNRARMRLVRTGKDYSQGVEIVSGLSAGDVLIIDSSETIHDGQKVHITSQEHLGYER